MRTLNKTLCLVLALVMVFGMLGTASAANFTDDATIQYKEAVGVMTGIEAINGMGDGTFAPAGNVTRAQAAKMVAYAVLGKGMAEKLPVVASSFKDVDANFAWAIPSIEYLVGEGVINGRGDGTFDPAGDVTAYEIAKMLLCAAGYGVNDEYVGNSWAITVAIDAQKNGVFADTKATELNAAASREECALYCFNVLTDVEMVRYGEFVKRYVGLDTDLGWEVYGLDYDYDNNEGLDSKVWYLDDADDTVVYVYNLDTIAATYKAGTKVSTIAADFGFANTDKSYDVEIYRNGVYKETLNKTGAEFNAMTTTVIPGGVTVDVVVPADESADLRLLYNVHYLASLTNVVKDDATTTADERELVIGIVQYAIPYTSADNPTGALPLTVTAKDYANFDAIYAMVKDQTEETLAANPVMVDVVPYGDSYTYTATQHALGEPTIKSVALPTTVEGKVAVKGTGTITVGDKTYLFGHKFFSAAGTLLFEDTYKFVLDATGAIAFALPVEEAATADEYAYAIAPTGNTSALGTEWTFAINGEQVNYYVTNDSLTAGNVYTIKATTDEETKVTTYAATDVATPEYAGTVTAISSKLFVATKDSTKTYNYADAYGVYDLSEDATVIGEATTLAEGDHVNVVIVGEKVILAYVVDAPES